MTEPLPPEEQRYAGGAAAVVLAILKARSANLRPPPKLTLSQWAAENAMRSPETSAQTGRFRAYAYQVGMMDAVTDPSLTQVTVMKSARVGYTKILDNVVGYYIAQDASPMLLVQPRVEDAEDYSATEIAPMLRDTPVLAAIAGDLKAKDAQQKLLKRVFRNGASISFVGANSPGGFSSAPALAQPVFGTPPSGSIEVDSKGKSLIGSPNAVTGTLANAGDTTTAILLRGPFNSTLSSSAATSVIAIEKSFDGGATWATAHIMQTSQAIGFEQVYGDYTSNLAGSATGSLSIIFNEPEAGVLYRMRAISISGGTVTARLSQ